MMRPFRFSVQVAQAESRQEWIELVKRAEDAGFDMIVTADHLEQCLAPLIPLATAAEVSERLRLGIMVLNNDLYHPSMLARDAATLDLLSEGRVEVGIGAGHAKPEYERAGIPFDPAGTRVGRLEEAVLVLRRLLDGQTVTFDASPVPCNRMFRSWWAAQVGEYTGSPHSTPTPLASPVWDGCMTTDSEQNRPASRLASSTEMSRRSRQPLPTASEAWSSRSSSKPWPSQMTRWGSPNRSVGRTCRRWSHPRSSSRHI